MNENYKKARPTKGSTHKGTEILEELLIYREDPFQKLMFERAEIQRVCLLAFFLSSMFVHVFICALIFLKNNSLNFSLEVTGVYFKCYCVKLMSI